MWKTINIEDKQKINSYLAKISTEISELNFTNLFLWQPGQDIRYWEMDGFLMIRDGLKDYEYFFPVGEGDLTQAVKHLREVHEQGPLVFRCLDESMKDALEAAMPGQFTFTRTDDRDDYVYSVQELIDLSGRKFRNKRNFILGFLRENNFSYHRLTADTVDLVAHSQLEWCNQRNCELFPDLYREKLGIMRVLEHFSDLDYIGGYIEINGKVQAFTFAEPLTDDTVVIHIEKANDQIRGLYQFINQHFLEQEWKDFTYVNRECDLGIDGLRQAKLSYRPVRMITKYKAVEVGNL